MTVDGTLEAHLFVSLGTVEKRVLHSVTEKNADKELDLVDIYITPLLSPIFAAQGWSRETMCVQVGGMCSR